MHAYERARVIVVLCTAAALLLANFVHLKFLHGTFNRNALKYGKARTVQRNGIFEKILLVNNLGIFKNRNSIKESLKTGEIPMLYSLQYLELGGLYRQQPSPLLYSIDIWPDRNSRLTQRETNH